MKLAHGELAIYQENGATYLQRDGAIRTRLSEDELRWLVLIAGPAMLTAPGGAEKEADRAP